MSTLASPPERGYDLAAVPAGHTVVSDTNVFIYHLTQSPLTATCTTCLLRVEAGELSGYTAVAMLVEAIRTLGLTLRTVVRSLKPHPTLVTRLTEYRLALAAIPGFGVPVVPVIPAHLTAAQNIARGRAC